MRLLDDFHRHTGETAAPLAEPAQELVGAARKVGEELQGLPLHKRQAGARAIAEGVRRILEDPS